MNYFENRIEKVREQINIRNLDGFYITNLTNVRYLSGYSGSAGQLLILPDSQHFFTDGRYIEQSKAEVGDFEIHIIDIDYFTLFKKLNLLNAKLKIGFEANKVTVDTFKKMSAKENFPKINWVSTENIVELIAAAKDLGEIEILKAAIEITDKVFEDLIPELQIGAVERNIAAKLSYLLKTHGAEGDAFDPIIASGKNSALPHAQPGDKKLEKGDFLIMDFGAKYKGYCADMTRTVVIGAATDRHHEIYNIVLASHKAGIEAAQAGMTGFELDKVCRDVIEAKGYGKEFSHSTGHGIGIDVHSHPRVSKLNKEKLLENYVVTIEPGIYIADFGGVRIEDDIWLHKDGCTDLNRSTKEMLIVG